MYKLINNINNEVYTYITSLAEKVKRDKKALIYVINNHLFKVPDLKTHKDENTYIYKTRNVRILYSKRLNKLDITIYNKKTKKQVFDIGIYTSEITKLCYFCIACVNENICNKEIKEFK
jgi:hypothetical protein